MDGKYINPWTPEDEKEHFPCPLEWWCIISFFKTLEDEKRWSVKGSFSEWAEGEKEDGSVYDITLFDLDDDKYYTYGSKKEKEKLQTVKDKFLHVKYDDSWLKGSYPDHEVFFHDKKNNIKINLKYHAESLPRWVAQDTTGGWLPMGLGYYRYGFVPKNKVTGTIEINGKTYNLEGVGYFEHVWGDIWYDKPLSNFPQIKKIYQIYKNLIIWWIKNHKLIIPDSIMFSTENNAFGYDWIWAILDNGWMIFYGNILFWIMEGFTTGALVLSKDGKKYTEFGEIYFKYNKLNYMEKYDFYYPTEIELTAKHGIEKLELRFIMTNKSREFESLFTKPDYWLGFIICEIPGRVEGYYYDGNKKEKVTGFCKIEPQRQASVIGHNSLKLNFIKPPDGIGVDINLISHYLKKRINTKIHLAPRPKIRINLKKIKKEDITQYDDL